MEEDEKYTIGECRKCRGHWKSGRATEENSDLAVSGEAGGGGQEERVRDGIKVREREIESG